MFGFTNNTEKYEADGYEDVPGPPPIPDKIDRKWPPPSLADSDSTETDE